MKLTLMCVTKAEPHALPFLQRLNELAVKLGAQCVIAGDGRQSSGTLCGMTWLKTPLLIGVESRGFLESVHDQVLGYCDGEYVLRLDDDEQCSPAMARWLEAGAYQDAKHWKFPRAHLWKSEQRVLVTPHLWPDHQTRLSVLEMAGGRNHIHAGSPYGGGEVAPCVIEHHKFLVKSADERWMIAHRYDGIQQGAGTGGMVAFQVPEHAYAGQNVAFSVLGEGDAYEIDQKTVRSEGGLL